MFQTRLVRPGPLQRENGAVRVLTAHRGSPELWHQSKIQNAVSEENASETRLCFQDVVVSTSVLRLCTKPHRSEQER